MEGHAQSGRRPLLASTSGATLCATPDLREALRDESGLRATGRGRGVFRAKTTGPQSPHPLPGSSTHHSKAVLVIVCEVPCAVAQVARTVLEPGPPPRAQAALMATRSAEGSVAKAAHTCEKPCRRARSSPAPTPSCEK